MKVAKQSVALVFVVAGVGWWLGSADSRHSALKTQPQPPTERGVSARTQVDSITPRTKGRWVTALGPKRGLEPGDFVHFVQRTGLAMRSWEAIRKRLFERLGEHEGSKALRWLEDGCAEARTSAEQGFTTDEGLNTFQAVLEDRATALADIIAGQGNDDWRHVQELAAPYMYTCMGDFPVIGDALLDAVRSDLEALGVDTRVD